jgi:hypothetical protein
MPSRLAVRLIILPGATLADGCTTVWPKSRSETDSPPKSFDEVKRTFDGIEPGHTSLEELKPLGYDPEANANVTVLNQSDL